MTKMAAVELAPDCCIVCSKTPARVATEAERNAALRCHEMLGLPLRSDEVIPPIEGAWFYLAGSLPVGAVVCSKPCLEVALARFRATGRVDRGACA